MLTEQQIRELLCLSDSEQAVFWQGLTPEQASSLLDQLQAFRQTAAVQNDSRQSEYERRAAMVRAEVGEIPPIGNPERREYCRTDLLEFLRQATPTGLLLNYCCCILTPAGDSWRPGEFREAITTN